MSGLFLVISSSYLDPCSTDVPVFSPPAWGSSARFCCSKTEMTHDLTYLKDQKDVFLDPEHREHSVPLGDRHKDSLHFPMTFEHPEGRFMVDSSGRPAASIHAAARGLGGGSMALSFTSSTQTVDLPLNLIKSSFELTSVCMFAEKQVETMYSDNKLLRQLQGLQGLMKIPQRHPGSSPPFLLGFY